MVVAVLGTITLFTGTMQALKQEQTKRLLAFHSIGQIGYILLGTGACMALLPALGPNADRARRHRLCSGRCSTSLNHGLFKGLLFLNAGSMLHATGTQDLNKMGGLMKFMPLTAVTALVASFSISGVPLFNGFVSKWSIYVAAVQGSSSARYLAVCAVIAILTSALTLASFIKFFGVSFLSRTSTLVKAQAAGKGELEVGWTDAGAAGDPRGGLRPAGRRAGSWLPPDAAGLGGQPPGLGAALANAAPDGTAGSLGGHRARAIDGSVRAAGLRGGAGPGVPGRLQPSRSSAAPPAAPPLPGSAATCARRTAIVTPPTISTAKSNATSAGWAARRICRDRQPGQES